MQNSLRHFGNLRSTIAILTSGFRLHSLLRDFPDENHATNSYLRVKTQLVIGTIVEQFFPILDENFHVVLYVSLNYVLMPLPHRFFDQISIIQRPKFYLKNFFKKITFVGPIKKGKVYVEHPSGDCPREVNGV